jgi:hypothetical protein
MSRTRRLGVAVALFALVQTLAPTLVRHVGPSLSVSIRFRVSTLHSECGLLLPATAPTAEPEGAGEAPAESTNSNGVLELESLCWVDGTESSRSVQRLSATVEPMTLTPVPSRLDATERLRLNAWALGVARRVPGDPSAQLCRFLC